MVFEYFGTYQFVLEDLGISIAILLLFLIFRKIFSKYVFNLLLKIGKQAPGELLSQIFLAFEKPLQWLFIVIGVYFAARYFPYFDHTNIMFLNIIRAFIIFLVSWGLYNLAGASSMLFHRINERSSIEIDRILIPFLSKALRFIIVAISFSIIAQEFGYEISGLIAGLGIGGLAVSLAAKDALANFFGGIVIITEKPFSIGDLIRTPSVEGTIEDISFRSTKVRTAGQGLVTVPNATLANEPITNLSKMEKRQITFNLSLPLGITKGEMQDIIKQIRDLLKNNPEIDQEAIQVSFDQYKENGFGIYLNFFTKETAFDAYLKVKEEINYKIMEILQQGKVDIAPSIRVSIGNETKHGAKSTEN